MDGVNTPVGKPKMKKPVTKKRITRYGLFFSISIESSGLCEIDNGCSFVRTFCEFF
jgi:hypothetical protein